MDRQLLVPSITNADQNTLSEANKGPKPSTTASLEEQTDRVEDVGDIPPECKLSSILISRLFTMIVDTDAAASTTSSLGLGTPSLEWVPLTEPAGPSSTSGPLDTVTTTMTVVGVSAQASTTKKGPGVWRPPSAKTGRYVYSVMY